MARTVHLSSTRSPHIQRVRDTAAGSEATEMVVDGARLVGEVLATPLRIELAVLAEGFAASEAGSRLQAELAARAGEIAIATEAVVERMSSLTTPQGVLVICQRPRWTASDLCGAQGSSALIVVAAGVRDPGNLGAMLRATEAAGGTGFVALRGSADPFRDKAVRGSSGSVLRVPTIAGMTEEQLCAFATERGLRIVTTDGQQGSDYLDADLRSPTLLVLGSEGHGVPDELVAAASARVRIPIRPPVESLNVAVATGVLLFEARRQRRG